MTDKFINTGIINSYKLIMGEKTMDEIVEKSKMPIFFIHPDENYDNEDLDMRGVISICSVSIIINNR